MNDSIIAAVYRKDFSTLDELLTQSNVDSFDNDKRTPLIYAVLDQSIDVVRYLIKKGADVNVADGVQKWTPLHFAARDQLQDIVHVLLEANAQVDVLDVFGNTPLWRCVMSSSPNLGVVRQLLLCGANPDRKNYHGVSPRDLANTAGDNELLQVLDN